jgi:hypothetical protein
VEGEMAGLGKVLPWCHGSQDSVTIIPEGMVRIGLKAECAQTRLLKIVGSIFLQVQNIAG